MNDLNELVRRVANLSLSDEEIVIFEKAIERSENVDASIRSLMELSAASQFNVDICRDTLTLVNSKIASEEKLSNELRNYAIYSLVLLVLAVGLFFSSKQLYAAIPVVLTIFLQVRQLQKTNSNK